MKTPMWVRISVCAAAALATGWVVEQVDYTRTPSLVHRWFIQYPGTPGYGDYAWFELEHPGLPAGPQKLTKRVGCAAGQQLVFEAGQHYCDKRPLGRPLPADSEGRPLPVFVWNGVVPVGKAYMMGDTDNSFDSRYFGFVDVDGLHRVVPLW